VAGASRSWRYVVIHHSATAGGNAEQFDVSHRRDRGFDELGYHFVIDNGSGAPDGRVEVGPRWPKQKHGAHTGGTPNNEYNELGIGICLVGDFTWRSPSSAQLASLERLVAYLVETYGIPPENVITHRDAPGAHTECPGRLLDAYVHGQFKDTLGLKLASTCPAWRRYAG
jgi:N-acetyl-anhydromuramyl-L-alanine amidase AmpD